MRRWTAPGARRRGAMVLLAVLAVTAAQPTRLAFGTQTAVATVVETRADFNGDGYADLAIGAPVETNAGHEAAGVVHVLYGRPGGLTGVNSQTFRQGNNGLGDTPEPFDLFGRALATGDFDGDGYADLVISVFEGFDDVDNVGMIHVLYGGPNRLTGRGSRMFWPGADGIADPSPSGAPGGLFGWALTSGDFNGDGRADLAVGAPSQQLGTVELAGVVHVLYGTPTGLSGVGSEVFQQGQRGLGDEPEVADHFGSALAAGDFNGDGRDELVIGVPSESPMGVDWAGAAHVLLGTAAGLTGSGSLFLHQGDGRVPGVPNSFDTFGDTMATGDFNGDGRDDIAVGVPGEDFGGDTGEVGAGIVNVVYGSSTGLTGLRAHILRQGSFGVLDVPEENDGFSRSLATGDFNADGHTDLAVGVPGEDVGPYTSVGVVQVMYGSASGLTGSGSDLFMQGSGGVAETPEAFDTFGSHLAAGAFAGGNGSSLAIGVSAESITLRVLAGVVHVLRGGPDGLTGSGALLFFQSYDGVSDTPEQGDQFGRALAAT
jgi:hypothetical protein